jgi:hypothetical protein
MPAGKPYRLGQAYSPPREEGWLRHQENFGEAHVRGRRRGGRSQPIFQERFPKLGLCATTPSAPNKVASRHSLNVASTPPHKEGNTTPRVRRSVHTLAGRSAQLEALIQRIGAVSISTYRRASPRDISSPDCNRTPRGPGGTAMVLPFLRTLVPCRLRSSQRR